MKGPEWNPLLFANPPTLNNEESKGCMATYGVPPSQTPKVGSAQPMGFLLIKVDGWANSNGFHSGPFLGNFLGKLPLGAFVVMYE